ncbi:hypothetical protein [Delftia sp. ASV31]|uniref:hypothetical protein n=1 Tax=Delftia sp. ASV31 TaxID=2795113 RepID=UPI0018EDAC3B|nr:hypothetical protein [Delftia sp. ASV31]
MDISRAAMQRPIFGRTAQVMVGRCPLWQSGAWRDVRFWDLDAPQCLGDARMFQKIPSIL